MEDRWYGSAFQIFEATDEIDLEAAMMVLRGGTQVPPSSLGKSMFCKRLIRNARECIAPPPEPMYINSYWFVILIFEYFPMTPI